MSSYLPEINFFFHLLGWFLARLLGSMETDTLYCMLASQYLHYFEALSGRQKGQSLSQVPRMCHSNFSYLT